MELLFPKLLGFNFMRNVSESVWISDQTKVLAGSIGRYTYICSYISPTMISSEGNFSRVKTKPTRRYPNDYSTDNKNNQMK